MQLFDSYDHTCEAVLGSMEEGLKVRLLRDASFFRCHVFEHQLIQTQILPHA